MSVELSDHGSELIGLKRKLAGEKVKESEDAKGNPTLKIVKGGPLSYLREFKEDG